MMRRGGETPDEEKARFAVSRDFAKRVKEILGDAPDIVFEHVGQATFPTSVFTGQAVRQGRHLRRARPATTSTSTSATCGCARSRSSARTSPTPGSATKANELIEDGKIRPVLWRTMGFDEVAEAHQLMRENKHLGKIAILVGARGGPGPHGRGPGRDPRRGGRLRRGRRRPDPLVRDRPARRQARGRAGGDRADRAALRRAAYASTAPRRPLQVPADGGVRAQGRLRALLVRPEFTDFRALASSWYQVPVALRLDTTSSSAGTLPEPRASGRQSRASSGAAPAERAVGARARTGAALGR